jgi:hypothetical protein
MRLATAEQAGNSREKAAAGLLRTSPGLGFRNLFLESGYSALRVRESLLHHQSALHQQVGRRRNLSDLAPNQLISLGIFRLITCLTQPIKETGYEILFFGCHMEKETFFPTLTSPSCPGSKMSARENVSAYRRFRVGKRVAFRRNHNHQEVSTKLMTLRKRRYADTSICFPLSSFETVFARPDENEDKQDAEHLD